MAKKDHTTSKLVYISGGWNPVDIRLPRRYTKHSDGTSELSEITPDDIARFEDGSVHEALKQLHSFGVIEPLLFQLEQGNPAILRNPEAVRIIAEAVRGKGIKGRGRKKSPAVVVRDRRICQAVHELNEMGYPIKGDLEVETACRLVAKRIELSAEQVYTIWNAREPDLDNFSSNLYRSFHYWRHTLTTPGWVPTTPEDVLQEYFPKKEGNAGERETEIMEALAKEYFRCFYVRVINAIKRRPGNRWGL